MESMRAIRRQRPALQGRQAALEERARRLALPRGEIRRRRSKERRRARQGAQNWARVDAHRSAEALRTVIPIQAVRDIIARELEIATSRCVHRYEPCRSCHKLRCMHCDASTFFANGAGFQPCLCWSSRRRSNDVLEQRLQEYEYVFDVDVPKLHGLYPHLFEGCYAPWATANFAATANYGLYQSS